MLMSSSKIGDNFVRPVVGVVNAAVKLASVTVSTTVNCLPSSLPSRVTSQPPGDYTTSVLALPGLETGFVG